MGSIVTPDEVKTHLGTDPGSDVIAMLIEDADAKIDDLAGPVVARAVTETVTLRHGYGLLRYIPLGDVQAVTGSDGRALTGWSLDDIGGIGGLHSAALGALPAGGYGQLVQVTYLAGRVADGEPVPARFKRAALRYIAWSWRRDHGGSDSYMPGGDDATPGLGVAGIDKELHFILGQEVRAGRVA